MGPGGRAADPGIGYPPSVTTEQEDEMKKKVKKLVLAKETVGRLENGIENVEGGDRGNSINSGCDFTCRTCTEC
jgi:hypothetical protein